MKESNSGTEEESVVDRLKRHQKDEYKKQYEEQVATDISEGSWTGRDSMHRALEDASQATEFDFSDDDSLNEEEEADFERDYDEMIENTGGEIEERMEYFRDDLEQRERDMESQGFTADASVKEFVDAYYGDGTVDANSDNSSTDSAGGNVGNRQQREH